MSEKLKETKKKVNLWFLSSFKSLDLF
jgi:hypothetical protein